MTGSALLRLSIPVVLAVVTALYFNVSMRRRGLMPPGLRDSLWRRFAASLLLVLLFGGGVFSSLAFLGSAKMPEPDVSQISRVQLFAFHILMLVTIGTWFLLGFAGRVGRGQLRPRWTGPAAEPGVETGDPVDPIEAGAPSDLGGPVQVDPIDDGGSIEVDPVEAVEPLEAGTSLEATAPGDAVGRIEPVEAAPALYEPAAVPVVPPSLGRLFAQQFGLVAPSIPREIGLGLSMGLGIWAAVLAVLALVGIALYAFGGSDATPKEIPALVTWLAAQPILLRFGISLSAGFVEELFFRGFLQPRIGLLASTAIFALAHLSYGQPFMLIGVTLLSLIYGLLVRWRQSVWAAMAAHALFDGIQLLLLVPGVVRLMGGAGKGASALLSTYGLW